MHTRSDTGAGGENTQGTLRASAVVDRVVEGCIAIALRDTARAADGDYGGRHRSLDDVLGAIVGLAPGLLEDEPVDDAVERRIQLSAALTHAAGCCERLVGAAGVERPPLVRLADIRPWDGDRRFGLRRTPMRQLDGLVETVLVLRRAAGPPADDVTVLLAAGLALDSAYDMLGGAISLEQGTAANDPVHPQRARWILEEVTDQKFGRGWQDALTGRVRSPTWLLLSAMSVESVPALCGPADHRLVGGPDQAANLTSVRALLVEFARDVLAAAWGMSASDRVSAPSTDDLVLDVARMFSAFPVIGELAPDQLTVAARAGSAHAAASFALRHAWELVSAPHPMRETLVQDKLRVALVDAVCAIGRIDEYHATLSRPAPDDLGGGA